MRIALALLLIAAPARADDREGAGAHFQAAQAAEKRSDWQDAIDEYEKAYKLAPHPSVLFNIGNDYEKLGQLRQAADYLGRYLRDDPNAEDRVVVARRIVALRERPSVLHVDEPRGATLLLDGAPHGTIALSIDVPAGTHRVQAERDGERSAEQIVTAEYGEPLAISLPIAPKQLPPPNEVYSRASLGISAGVGVPTGIRGEWGGGASPVAFTSRVRGTLSLSRKLRAFVDLGGSYGPYVEDARVDSDLGPTETFLTVTPRGGITYSLIQTSIVRFDAVGFATLLAGYHKLSFGGDVVAKQAVFGAGFGGGLEVAGTTSESPRTQWYGLLTYAVVPTAVGDGTGLRSTGTVDLGGFEVLVGVSVLLGKPSQASPSMIAPNTRSARR